MNNRKQRQSKIKSLHIIQTFSRGGIEVWLKNAMLNCSGSSVEIDACCTGKEIGELAEGLRKIGRRVHHVPLERPKRAFVEKLCKVIEDGRYDVVHWHTEKAIEPIVETAKEAGVPSIITIHNTKFDVIHSLRFSWLMKCGARRILTTYVGWKLRKACQSASMVTAVSRAALDALTAFTGDHADSWKVFILGVPLSPPLSNDGESFRRNLMGDDTAPLILHVGRFSPQKNHIGMIEILKILKDQFPEIRLCLVGNGYLLESVRAYVQDAGLTNNVLFLGLRDDVYDIMRVANVFLLPSLHEGLPVTIMEAFACGLPVVASRVPGNVDAVQHQENGLLCKVDEPKEFAKAIQQILSDKDLAKSLSEKGQKTFLNEFSMDACLARMEDLYREVIV